VRFSALRLILLLALAISLLSVYYQYTYQTLDTRFKAASEELEMTRTNLTQKEAELAQKLGEVSTLSQREKELGARYASEKSAREKAEQELANTKELLAQAQQALQERTVQLNEALDQIEDLNDRINRLEGELQQKESTIDSLQSQLDECRANQQSG